MALYRTNVVTFDAPETWQDQSITAFRLPAAPGGGDGSFVVTRDGNKGVGEFGDYVDGQLDTCRRSLPSFELLRSDRLTAKERPAAWIEFTWSNNNNPLQLRQVYFDCGFFVTICTLTCAPRDVAFFDEPWQRLMASLVFDRPETVAAFGSAS